MIKPFQDDGGAASIGELSVENSTDAVAISGDLAITRDKVGLKRARALKRLADTIVKRLEAEDDLPDKVAVEPSAVDEVENPFR